MEAFSPNPIPKLYEKRAPTHDSTPNCRDVYVEKPNRKPNPSLSKITTKSLTTTLTLSSPNLKPTLCCDRVSRKCS